jgi:glycerophosphoryl diester phosphodiesterase
MLEREFAASGKIIVQGHRGALGHAPENTMHSFAVGYSMGADVLELDVHLSRDKHLVVMHDAEVSRTTGVKGRVKDMTVDQIKALNAAATFPGFTERLEVPLLGEVLAWAKDKIDLVVEIKGDPTPAEGIEKLVVDEIFKYGMEQNTTIISFYHGTLKKVAELCDIPTGILYVCRPVDPVALAKQANADSFRCDWKYMTAEDTKAAHDAGLWTSCWGANTAELYERMAKIGVDSLGSDYPDQLRAWLDERNLGVGNWRSRR